jgi:hypothetical protein
MLPLIINCSKSTKIPICNDDTETPVDFSPRENEEAELVALCLSGEIVAPDNLYEQVLHDLATIRATFGDSLEAVKGIKFRRPWQPGELGIGFDDTTAQQILDEEYHAWDTLNETYELTGMDTRHLTGIRAVFLTFRGRLHAWRLAELYSQLPGVETTGPNYIIGDGSSVYARQALDGMTYLFRHGWGDCPNGCLNNEYWYFIFEDGHPVFMGHWPNYEGEPQPAWWSEARLNMEHYCD